MTEEMREGRFTRKVKESVRFTGNKRNVVFLLKFVPSFVGDF